MTSRGIARLALVAAVLLLHGGTAVAQSNAVVVVDPAIAAIGFAAGDVRTALQAKGTTVRTAAPNELSRQTAAVQIVITTMATSLDGQPAVSGLAPQGYAIRRIQQGTGQPTRWWAIGADISGAMYAGLGVADGETFLTSPTRLLAGPSRPSL